MPCGGIWPTKVPDSINKKNALYCLYCSKRGNLTHFCEEWDGFLHKECIDPYLTTEEGKVVLSHGHVVIR